MGACRRLRPGRLFTAARHPDGARRGSSLAGATASARCNSGTDAGWRWAVHQARHLSRGRDWVVLDAKGATIFRAARKGSGEIRQSGISGA